MRQAKCPGRLIPILSSFMSFLSLSDLMKEEASLNKILMKLNTGELCCELCTDGCETHLLLFEQ